MLPPSSIRIIKGLRMIKSTLAVALLLAGGSACATELIVQAGSLLPRADQSMQGAKTLWIKGEQIAGISDGHVDASAFAGAAANAQVIDARAFTVLPGLIDSHVHLTSDKGGIEAQLGQLTQSIAAQAYEAQVNAGKTVRAGFTTVRNLGDADGVTLALRDAIAAGKVVGPRILDAGLAISATSGHIDLALGFRDELREPLSRGQNLCDGPDDCRRAVRLQISRGANVIKMATTGGVNSRIGLGLGAQMFADEAKAIVETAHLYEKRVAAHAHGADGIKIALEAGADSIEHGTLMDAETIRLFKANGAYYVPTLSTVNGYLERLAANPDAYPPAVKAKIEWRIGITGKSLQLAHAAGVKIAFGTDAGVSKHGRNADEFEWMVKHGMTPRDALIAATLNAADLLGVSAEVGSLEVGKVADLIAVAGDPLQDVQVLKQMQLVVKSGAVVVDVQPGSESTQAASR